MGRIEPSKPRFTVIDTAEGVRIVIPTARKWDLAFFYGLIEASLASLGVMMAWKEVRDTHLGSLDRSTLLFLAGWFGLCFYVVYLMLWNLWGQELVVLGPGAFIVRRELFGLGRSREFDPTEIKALRVSSESYNPARLFTWRIMFGGWATIAFDYGARTYRFGYGLEEAEARMIIAEIARRSQIPIG